MRSGDSYLASNTYHTAQHYYESAQKLIPLHPEPYAGLGRIEFRRARYALSLEYVKKAFELGKETDGAHAYAIYLAQDALGKYDDATRTLSVAERLFASNPEMRLTAVYDQGLMNLLVWLEREAPRDTERARTAELRFRSFLEAKGFPTHWAHYHLACLWAKRSEDASLGSEALQKIRQAALQSLDTARKELAAYESEKAEPQREMVKILLNEPSTWKRKAGHPVACSALGSIQGLAAKSLSPDT